MHIKIETIHKHPNSRIRRRWFTGIRYVGGRRRQRRRQAVMRGEWVPLLDAVIYAECTSIYIYIYSKYTQMISAWSAPQYMFCLAHARAATIYVNTPAINSQSRWQDSSVVRNFHLLLLLALAAENTEIKMKNKKERMNIFMHININLDCSLFEHRVWKMRASIRRTHLRNSFFRMVEHEFLEYIFWRSEESLLSSLHALGFIHIFPFCPSTERKSVIF